MSDITIKEERPRVEELLARYRAVIGSDYDGYRNHVYRVITYAMHFLNDAPEHEQLVETAFVYHDIGLWTDHELAYLEPSEVLWVSQFPPASGERIRWFDTHWRLQGNPWHCKIVMHMV